jgi:hypothetical protein
MNDCSGGIENLSRLFLMYDKENMGVSVGWDAFVLLLCDGCLASVRQVCCW